MSFRWPPPGHLEIRKVALYLRPADAEPVSNGALTHALLLHLVDQGDALPALLLTELRRLDGPLASADGRDGPRAYPASRVAWRGGRAAPRLLLVLGRLLRGGRGPG
jgi:hypothetical protein